MSSDLSRSSESRSTRGPRKERKSGSAVERSNSGDSSSAASVSARASARATDKRGANRHLRQPSDQSLKLDLHGLDLGGDAGSSAGPYGESLLAHYTAAGARDSIPFLAHERSRSGGLLPTTTRSPALVSEQYFSSSEDLVTRSNAMSGNSLAEDSFAIHLRSECTDFTEIMPSTAILRAESDGHLPFDVDAAGPSSLDHQHHESYQQISTSQRKGHFKQVLGGFASLGTSEHESMPSLVLSSERQPPQFSSSSHQHQRLGKARETEARADQGAQAAGYFRQGDLAAAAAASNGFRWAYLAPQPCDPLKMLDVLSIQEMGLHSVDVGKMDDWEGHTFSADFLCPHNKVLTKISWSVATSVKRQRKWIVVPETYCESSKLCADDQGYRTVVVSDRPLTADESVVPWSRSSFGKAGFELNFLRRPAGTFSSTVLLARPDVHRMRFAKRRMRVASMRTESDSCPTSPGTLSVHSEAKILPFYPVLRRSRSRPYIRDHTHTLRRSRSKPYLKSGEKSHPGDATDFFAPSLPGAPGAQYQPTEVWPSARPPASPLGSAHSSRSSSASHTSQSSIGLVTTSYSQASTCGMSEAPVSESVRSKTSVASPASPRTPSSVGASGQEPNSAAAYLSSLDAGDMTWTRGCVEPMQAADEPTDEIAKEEKVSATTGLGLEGPEHAAVPAIESALPLPVASNNLARIPTAESVTPGHLASRSTRRAAAANVTRPSAVLANSNVHSQPHRKERKIGSWFKKRVSTSHTHSGPSKMLSASAPSRAGHARDTSMNGHVAGQHLKSSPSRAVALTRKALEQIEALVDRPASPESTIVGSRRGSACVTGNGSTAETYSQATTAATLYNEGSTPKTKKAEKAAASSLPVGPEAGSGTASPKFDHDQVADGASRLDMMESRAAVKASLARIYGWTEQPAMASPGPGVQRGDAPCHTHALNADQAMRRPGALGSQPRSGNTDEENIMLGLDRVTSDALTMLVPLPLIGRPRDMPASRYMRISFTPFGGPTPSSECSAGVPEVASTDRESPAGSSCGASTQRGGAAPSIHGHVDRHSGSTSSSWYRRLGFASGSRQASSHSGSRAAAKEASTAAFGASTSSNSLASSAALLPTAAGTRKRTTSGTTMATNIDSFRIAGQILDAPDVDHASSIVERRIPRAGSFPVVLGFCDGRHGLELVQEGFDALGLIGGPDQFAIQKGGDCPPLAGVTDMIIAACAAIIDA